MLNHQGLPKPHFFTLAEDIIGSFEQQLLPPIDLARMNIIFRRYLVDSSMPLQRLNGYLGFKKRPDISTE